MKFIRDNAGLVFIAVLIFALIGWMVLFFVSNPAGFPAGASAPRVSESPTLRAETLAPSVTARPEHRVTETPNNAICSDVLAAVRAAVPLNGVQFASPGGAAKSVSVWGVTTGEIKSQAESGIELHLARLLYLDNDKALRSLWFATGYVDKSGTYFPMNIIDPRSRQVWATRQEAEAIFQQTGKGIRLTLTGFLRGDKEIAWESCEQWSYANPTGICGLGLDIELASHGGGSQFLQTGIAPEGWFAFGWDVELNGPDANISDNAGECAP